jgi:ubiquinone biosynthesis protein Coq4
MARLIVGVARLARDLKRLNQVFEINDQIVALRTPGDEAAVVADFASHPIGAAALRERHRLGKLDLAVLRALPEDTLGGAYARFLERHDISPDSLPVLPVATDIDYIIAHYYETHDLWHVLAGFEADPAGELGIQAFLLAQSRSYLPLFVIAAVLLNTALYGYDDRIRRLDAISRGWTIGRASERIAGIDWRSHLTRPLREVRRDVGLA